MKSPGSGLRAPGLRLLSQHVFRGRRAGYGDDCVFLLYLGDGRGAGLLFVGAERRAGHRVDERVTDVEDAKRVADLEAGLGADVDPDLLPVDLDDAGLEGRWPCRRREPLE